MRRLTHLALAAVLAGCVTDHRPWRPVEQPWQTDAWFGPKCSILLPDGWMRLNGLDRHLVATRDGFGLQKITVVPFEAGKPWKHSKRTVRSGMAPREVAEVAVDEIRSDPSVKSVKVIETRPTTLAGKPGFRVSLSMKDEEGLPLKAILAGLLDGESGWRITYVAPARHYFDLDAREFDKALQSFQVR